MQIILPAAPPIACKANMGVAGNPIVLAVFHWKVPNIMLETVLLPEIKLPNKPTIGADIARKTFTLDSIEICFQIWDLSGQQSFKTISPQFYNRSDAVILVFDITRRDSFTNLSSWLEEILDQTGRIPIVVVGNKIDLVNKTEDIVPQQEAKEYVDHVSSVTGINAPYIQASAINRQNNFDPFITLGKLLIEKQ